MPSPQVDGCRKVLTLAEHTSPIVCVDWCSPLNVVLSGRFAAAPALARVHACVALLSGLPTRTSADTSVRVTKLIKV